MAEALCGHDFAQNISRQTSDRQPNGVARRAKWRHASNIQHAIHGSAGQILYVPLPGFAAFECSFAAPKVAGSCTGFQAVAEAQSCCKRFQTVSVCFKPRKSRELIDSGISVSSYPATAPMPLSQGRAAVTNAPAATNRAGCRRELHDAHHMFLPLLFRCVRSYPLPGCPNRRQL
jgi:hypothetical protein